MLIRELLLSAAWPTICYAPEGDNKGSNGTGQDQDDDEAKRRAAAADDQGDGEDDGDDAGGDEDAEAELERLRKTESEYKALTAKHNKVLKERKSLSERLRRWNQLGDADDVANRLSHQEQQEEAEARRSGDTERLLAAYREKSEKEKAELTSKLTQNQKLIEELTIDQELKAALTEVKVDPRLLDGAYGLHRRRMKLIEDLDAPRGLRVVAMFDDDEMPLKDYVKQWAESDPNAGAYILAPVNAGGGAQPGRRETGNMLRKPRDSMTIKEKTAFIAKYGQDEFLKLPLTAPRKQ